MDVIFDCLEQLLSIIEVIMDFDDDLDLLEVMDEDFNVEVDYLLDVDLDDFEDFFEEKDVKE